MDIDFKRVANLNKKVLPIHDEEMSHFLNEKSLNLRTTLDKNDAYADAKYVIIATPTDYDVLNRAG